MGILQWLRELVDVYARRPSYAPERFVISIGIRTHYDDEGRPVYVARVWLI